MRLRTAHDDPVGTLLDHVDVEVRVGLLGRPDRAVALDVGLRDRDGEVVVAAPLVQRPCPFVRLPLQDPHEGEHRVGADLLDQRRDARGAGRRQLDRTGPGEQVLGRARDPVQQRDRPAGVVVVDDERVAVLGLLGHVEVDAGHVDRHAQVGFLGDVVDAAPAVVHDTTVAERLQVLGGCTHGPVV